MAQITDAINSNFTQAVRAWSRDVETGEQEAREHHPERRDTYRSAEEHQLRCCVPRVGSYAPTDTETAAATDSDAAQGPGAETPATPTATTEPRSRAPRVMPLGAYASHPPPSAPTAAWPTRLAGLFDKAPMTLRRHRPALHDRSWQQSNSGGHVIAPSGRPVPRSSRPGRHRHDGEGRAPSRRRR